MGSASAANPQNTTNDSNLTANSHSANLATSNIYVNAKTGNDAWDGSNSNHTNGTNIGPKQHISSGITASTSGGNLYIANGTYYETLTVDRSLNIYGASRDGTIVDAQQKNIVFRINSNINVTIQNFTIINGKGPKDCGGIYNQGTLILKDCNIYNNKASDGADPTEPGGIGAGIYNTGTLNIQNCDIHNNTAGNGGDASATRHGSQGGDGGGIYNTGTLNIQDSQIHDNNAGNGGHHSDFYSGSYGGYGGGIYNTNILNIANCEIYNNKAGNGASNVAYANAAQGGHGGGIYNSGTAILQNINLHDNTAGTGGTVVNVKGTGGEGGYGGAIYNTGNLTITGNKTQIAYNTAGTGGESQVLEESAGAGGKAGGIYNTGTCHITSAIISNNKGGAGGNPFTLDSNGGDGGSGGAIYNEAAAILTLEDCSINNNQAGNGHSGVTNDKYLNFGGGIGGNGGSGGAIFNLGTTNINNSIISGNKAGNAGNGGQSTLLYDGRIGGHGGDGGGIYNTANLNITESSINDNNAGNGGKGGLGRAMADASSTAYYNPGNGGNGGNGGGIWNSGTINTLINTIIQKNTAGTGGNGGKYEVNATLYDPGIRTPAIPGIGGSGGGIYNTGILNTLENVTIGGNTAGTGGAGSPCSDSGPEDGAVGGNGGGIYILNTPITINDCEITNNHAGDGGKGSDMYVGPDMDPAGWLEGKGGPAGSGGGMYIDLVSILSLNIKINNTVFNNNTAGNGGAGGNWNDTVPLPGTGGNGGSGGGIGIKSTSDHNLNLQIYKSTFINNGAGLGYKYTPPGINGADGVGGALWSNNNQNFLRKLQPDRRQYTPSRILSINNRRYERKLPKKTGGAQTPIQQNNQPTHHKSTNVY